MITTEDIHRNYYKKIRKQPLVKIRDYRKIVNCINKKIRDKVIFGESIRLPRLGTLSVVKRDRDFSNPKVNISATMKLKEQLISEGKTIYKEWKDGNGELQNNGGEQYLVYYTDDFYYMFNLGNNRRLKNDKDETWWFTPTSTSKQMLTKSLKK